MIYNNYIPEFVWQPFEKVAKTGAEFLDSYSPGWHRKIDISNLRMLDSDACICGQLFVDNVKGYSGYGWFSDNHPDSVLYENGFVVPDTHFGNMPVDVDTWLDDNFSIDAWEMLAMCWIVQIEKRLAND